MATPPEPPGEPTAEQPNVRSGATDDTEASRQRRIETLRQLAQPQAPQQEGLPSTVADSDSLLTRTPLPIPGSRRRRPWWALISVAVVVVVVAAALGSYVFIQAHTNTSHPIPTTLTISPANCPGNIAWSPDGRTLAALTFPCAGNGGTTSTLQDGIITLYDATTGLAKGQFSLAKTLSADAGGGVLDGLSWTPDGHQLALEVNASANLATGPITTYDLLLFPIQGGQIQTIEGTPLASTNRQGQADVAPIWNIKTKQLVSVLPVPAPAALTYTWSADGRLIADQPFPSASAGAYSGRPTSAHTISFWQDGALVPVFWKDAEGFSDQSKPAVAVEFTTGPRALWSPDGSEVTFATFDALLAGSLTVTATLCAQLVQATLAPACSGADVVVSPPDAAVANLAKQVLHPTLISNGQGDMVPFYNNPPLSWSPQGTVLATVLPSDNPSLTHSRKIPVTLLDVAGQHSGALSYACGGSACGVDGLAWSPSGAQLALVDSSGGDITLWNTQSVKG